MKLDKVAMNDAYIKKNLVDPATFATWAELVANTPKEENPNKMNNGRQENKGNNDTPQPNDKRIRVEGESVTKSVIIKN